MNRCCTLSGGPVIRSGRRIESFFGTATFLRGVGYSLALAAAVAILSIFGGLYYLDLKNREMDHEVDAEFLNVFSYAHQIATHRRFADQLDTFVANSSLVHPNLIIWNAQHIRPGKNLFRAGNAEEINLPDPIPRDWFQSLATRRISDDKTVDFQTRGKAALIGAGTQQPMVIFVGRDLTGDASRAQTILWAGGIALAGVFIFVFMSAMLTAQFVWSRIRDISRTAEDIIRGDLSRRIHVGDRQNEFDNLSDTLNLMLDRIQKLLSGMKEVSDNIAHDLRTPLYRLKTRIELALVNVGKSDAQSGPREALELALKEADKLLLTFNGLLSIARLESGAMRDNLGKVDLSEVVHDVADLFEPAAEERDLSIVAEIEGGLEIRANRTLIAQALSNLVDNALKYSPVGGRVLISAHKLPATRSHRAAVDLVVADQGPGIAEADRKRVLERFVRLDHGHGAPGSGLGLSLVSAIASLHEAVLTLEDSADGLGLTVRLRFNAA